MVRDILAARCDVACVLSYVHRRMYTGNRNILQITFRRGNEVPQEKKNFNHLGHECFVREILRITPTYPPHVLCINILLLRVYTNLLVWVYTTPSCLRTTLMVYYISPNYTCELLLHRIISKPMFVDLQAVLLVALKLFRR